MEGRSGIDWITLFDYSAYPVKIDGEVRNFDPTEYMDRKDARRMARFSQFSVAAAGMALADSGLKVGSEDATRIGVLLGNGNGGLPESDDGMHTIIEKGGNRLDPFYMSKMLPNIAAAQIAMHYGLKGYNNTVSTACAASTQAMGDAADIIRMGRADVMVAGGGEAGICELGLAGFNIMHALSPAMTTRSWHPGLSTRTAMASSAPRAPASSSSNRWSTPRSAAPASWPSLPATAPAQTPTTSSLPALTARAPSARSAWPSPTPVSARTTSTTSTPTARRPRPTTPRRPLQSRACSASGRTRSP